MLNNKMYAVAVAIEEVIIHTLPIEYQLYVFEGKTTIKDIISQVLMECCKYAHDNLEEKHSLNYYLNAGPLIGNADSERMTRKRTMDYIQERRNIQHKELLLKGYSVDGLLATDMSDLKDKIAGHKLNSFQYWEINNVHDMRLVKGIVERRIGKKNFNIDSFIEYADEYDRFFKQLVGEWNSGDENAIFDCLAMFTLEWKYSFDFYYELATEMVNVGVSEIPDIERRISAFCGTPSINSMLLMLDPRLLDGTIHMDSRMLVSRRKYIHDIVALSIEDFEDELNQFVESLVIVAHMLRHMTYRKVPIREWFLKNTTAEDWISVFRNYGVFQAFISEKDWSDKKKIRYVKELYNRSSYDYKNPVFRS